MLSKPDANSNHNSKLVNYGLSLSAGSMVTTSLYKMLPVIDKSNRYTVFFGVVFGISFSLFLNYVVHAFASQSLIHCAHNEHDDEHLNNHHHEHSEDIIIHNTSYGATQSHEASNPLGQSERLTKCDSSSRKISLNPRKSFIDTLTSSNLDKGDCYGISTCPPLLKSDTNPCIASSLLSGTRKSRGNGEHNIVNNENNDETIRDTDNYDQHHNENNVHNHSNQCGVSCMENTIGYDLENLSVYRKNYFSGNNKITVPDSSSSSTRSSANSLSSEHNVPVETIERMDHIPIAHSLHDNADSIPFHHHHIETPFSKLLSIGMQTCLVLTLHKFPEGFIIFYTNKTKDDSMGIGFSIFISLAIHNFVEGFAMTLPFYSIFENKWLSILITTVLGGGSQPLGALIGYLIFNNKHLNNPNKDDSQPNMDLLLSITSGFLLVIALQMFQTGIGFSDVHHHHEDDDSSEVQHAHSLGTVCLRWCCCGVLLILGSSMFT